MLQGKEGKLSNSTFTSCHDWLEQLSKPIDDLSPSERLELEAHLVSCPTCSVIQIDYKMISDLIRSLPSPDFPPGLPPRLQQMLREEHEREDNSTISGALIAVDNSNISDDNYVMLSREENEISHSPASPPPVDATSEDTGTSESVDTVDCGQLIDTKGHFKLLRQFCSYLSVQHDVRLFVALTIGPIVNVYCAICRRMGLKVYFDRPLICHSCRRIFLFTAEEQRFYQQKGLTQQPGRCPSCRELRRASRRGIHDDMSESSQEIHAYHNEILHS